MLRGTARRCACCRRRRQGELRRRWRTGDGGAEWDDIKVGAYSVALGWGTIASADADTALGYFTAATGGESVLPA